MARRLLDRNRRREARRQILLIDRLARQFRGILERELTAAMGGMVSTWEMTQEVIPPRGFTERLEAIYLQMADASVEAFSRRILEQGKHLGIALEIKQDFAQTMRRRALRYIQQESNRRKITNVADVTRSHIISAVRQGYKEGKTLPEISQSIREAVPSIARYRADRIARTEVHGAANFGSNEAAKELGLPLRKEWLSAKDERTRTIEAEKPDKFGHKEVDGQVVGMEEKFLVPMVDGGTEELEYPGDPTGSPGNVINCRCTLGYIVDDGIDDWVDPYEKPAALT